MRGTTFEQFVLGKRIANPEILDWFFQVLHYAVLSGNLETVNLIVKQGAKLNYDEGFDLGKPSPLDLAILKGDPAIIEFLIQSGQSYTPFSI